MSKKLLTNHSIRAEIDRETGCITSIKNAADSSIEFLLEEKELPPENTVRARGLGNLALDVSAENKEYQYWTGEKSSERKVWEEQNRVYVEYSAKTEKGNGPVTLKEEFQISEAGLEWTIRIKNNLETPVEIKEVKIPIPINQYFRYDDEYKYEKCFLRHSCLCGENGWIYWQSTGGTNPVLVMKAEGDTSLCYYEIEKDGPLGRICKIEGTFEGAFCIFPYFRKNKFSSGKEKILCLTGKEEKRIQFTFGILPAIEDLKDWLPKQGGFYAEAVPGMTVPAGQPNYLYIYTNCMPEVRMDCPDDVCGKVIREKCRYKIPVILNGYGRRKIFIHLGDRVSELEMFGIEEPGRIFEKQGDFIAKKQFETDEQDPCFHGLLMWDLAVEHRINASCNPHGPDWFAGGSDEIGLVSGLFLSEKNRYMPVKKEVYVLQQYCRDFLEQRLTEMPGYKVHRMVPWYTMFDDWKGRGADDVWRAFNYIHVSNTFYNMYEIAQNYTFEFLEDPLVYLKKAWNYAMAMFQYWMFPGGTGATEYGNMGEHMTVLELLPALKREGMEREAEALESYIHKKADFFAGKRYPYGSEMAYDTTAYEAVYAYGKYLGDARVMKDTVRVVQANRGRNPVWYLYCTDLRQMGESQWNVSYMTQLGAWTFYDWTLEQGHYDQDILSSWYGSYFAGFSIYNSGGYWSDSPDNEGSSVWIIHGECGDYTGMVNGEPLMKGAVAMSGESALGFFGALKIAASVVMENENGEETFWGCSCRSEEGKVCYYPTDGLKMRFFHAKDGWAVKFFTDEIDKIIKEKNEIRILFKKRIFAKYGLRFMFRTDKSCRCVFTMNAKEKEVYFAEKEWKEIQLQRDEDTEVKIYFRNQ